MKSAVDYKKNQRQQTPQRGSQNNSHSSPILESFQSPRKEKTPVEKSGQQTGFLFGSETIPNSVPEVGEKGDDVNFSLHQTRKDNSPPRQMTTNKCKKVRCLVCNEILTYENDDTSVLVDHLNLEHSGLDVFRFLAHCQVSNSKINRRTLSGERGCSLEGGDNANEAPICKNQSKTYRTTVESWQPGPQCIICPKCGKEGQPVIKKQKNKMAKTPLGALCMLGCWPFCFLPFLFRRDQFLDLYCPCCKHFIGTYDKRKCCMLQPTLDTHPADKCNSAN